jgi:hypothetical protein
MVAQPAPPWLRACAEAGEARGVVPRSQPWRRWSAAPGALASWLVAGEAAAIDGVRPRTPVVWPDDVPCLVTVDRSATAVVNLPYGIPFDDPPAGEPLSDDEVADGRRHQFIAFSADLDPRVPMPAWIAMDDVYAAAMLGLVDPAEVDPASVLEGHPQLGDTFVRIDPDDERRPITFATAEAGAGWDTSAVAAGTYVVRAYTWDPWPNMWSPPRRGVVRVVDDAGDPSLVPALSIGLADPVLHRNERGTLDGCLAAAPGTELSAAWADFNDVAAAWTTFADGLVADDGVVAIPFDPPEALWGGFAALRVSAVDPSRLRFDAYVPGPITILASDAPTGCEGAGESGCESSSGSDATGPSDTGMPGTHGGDDTTGERGSSGGIDGMTTASTAGADVDVDEPAPQTCACVAHGAGPAASWLFWLVPAASIVTSRARRVSRRSAPPRRPCARVSVGAVGGSSA